MNDDVRASDAIDYAVGLKVRTARHGRQMTQAELAEKSNIRRTTIANIETGKQGVTLRVLCLIAAAMDLHPGSLLPQKGEITELAALTDELRAAWLRDRRRLMAIRSLMRRWDAEDASSHPPNEEDYEAYIPVGYYLRDTLDGTELVSRGPA